MRFSSIDVKIASRKCRRRQAVFEHTLDSDASASLAAIEHGTLRRTQGYSSAMLIHESRILQVTIFGTLHQNLNLLDFNLLLPDVMTIADEVDSQLTQTMESFTNGASKSGEAQLVKPTV
jgi:hypothetical protein